MTSTLEQFEGLKAGTWTIDASHSEVGFTVRHLMTKVRGQFESFEGKVTTGDTLADTKAEATVDLNSVNTRDAQRAARPPRRRAAREARRGRHHRRRTRRLLLRLRRHHVPQPAGDRARRLRRRTPLPRLVVAVEPRPGAPDRDLA